MLLSLLLHTADNLEQSRTEMTCADGGFLNDDGKQYAKPMCGLNLKECAVASVLVVVVAWYRKEGGVRCLLQRDGWRRPGRMMEVGVEPLLDDDLNGTRSIYREEKYFSHTATLQKQGVWCSASGTTVQY